VRPLVLADVGAGNREACARLRVHPAQRRFVAGVSDYLRMCDEGDTWHPVAAVVGGQVVGFAMWAVDDDGSHWIGGVVVDAPRQGQGIGRAFVSQLVERLGPEAGQAGLALAYLPDNRVARALYGSLGFVETGERDGDEVVARLRPAGLP
jgi:diamine N-acetyltransferase